jgi:transcriptional regulator with XRE-family HTH domain
MKKQTKETTKKKTRHGAPPVRTSDEQPLLAMLVKEAHRRSDTLAALAKALGVTYARLAQWRRNEALIQNGKRPVLEKAAQYLGLPTLFVLIRAGVVQYADFVWPGKKSLRDLVADQIALMRQDKKLGAFVPPELDKASAPVRMFMAFLFHELEQCSRDGASHEDWLSQLRTAAQTYLQESPVSHPVVTKAAGVKRSRTPR